MVPTYFSQGYMTPVFKRLPPLLYSELLNVSYIYTYISHAQTHDLSLPYFIGSSFQGDFGYTWFSLLTLEPSLHVKCCSIMQYPKKTLP